MNVLVACDVTIDHTATSAGAEVTPSTIAVVLKDADGATVTVAASAVAGTPSYVNLTAAELPDANVWEDWTLTWTWTYDGATHTDTVVLSLVASEHLDDLCSVSDVKQELNVTDTDADVQLAGYVLTASALLRRFVDITSPTVTETRVLSPGEGLRVPAPELVTITTVHDSAANDWPYSFHHGAVWLAYPLFDAWPRTDQLSVTGVWGVDEVPADIRRAVVAQSAMLYRRATFGAENNYLGRLDAMCQEMRDVVNGRA